MESVNIKDEKGNTYEIQIRNGEYQIYKKEGNGLTKATAEELEYVLEELKKIRSDLFKEDNKLDNYKNLLKQMVENGAIKDFESLKQFLNSTDLTEEEKNQLLNEGIGELDLQEIIDLKNKILENLENNKKPDLKAMISFNIKDVSLGEKYCEVKLGYKENENTITHISKVMTYNETLKKELIEPIILEVTLKGKLKNTLVSKTQDSFNNRGNFRLSTEDNTYLGINNSEYDYLQKLEERVTNLKDKEPIQDKEARANEVSELQNEEYQNNQDDVITDEVGNVYDLNGNYLGHVDEYGKVVYDNKNLEYDKGKKRVLVKENGFTMTLIISLTSFITSILMVLEILWLG